MGEVKRYELQGDGALLWRDDGEWVKHSEHAAELERYKALLHNADGPTQLPQLLTDAARPHYLTNDQVKALHPLDTKAFAEHTAAMTMVSERHGKGDLVILVTALLTLLARERAKLKGAPVGIWNSESQGASWGYAAELIPNGTRVALVVLPE